MNLRHVSAVTICLCLCTALLHAGEGWGTDWEAAKAEATKSGKDILIDFTGSDWCGWCKRLVAEVFSKDEFKAHATKNFVLMEVDFPQNKEQTTALKEQNAKLKEQFEARGFPTIYLANSSGLPYAKTGYQRGGPTAYISHLDDLEKTRITYDAAMKKAEAAEGLEKAKHLTAAIEPIPPELLTFYADVLEELAKLDPENKTGYRSKLIGIQLMEIEAEVQGLARVGKTAEIVAKLDAFIAEHKLAGEDKQKALFTKLSACPPTSLTNIDKAEAVLDAIIAIDKDTETGTNCIQIKKRLPDMRQRLAEEKK